MRCHVSACSATPAKGSVVLCSPSVIVNSLPARWRCSSGMNFFFLQRQDDGDDQPCQSDGTYAKQNSCPLHPSLFECDNALPLVPHLRNVVLVQIVAAWLDS